MKIKKAKTRNRFIRYKRKLGYSNYQFQLLGMKISEESESKDDNLFNSSEYKYIEETFADNLLEIVYTNLDDIRAGRLVVDLVSIQ